jgi:hypothetical protein
MWKNNTVVFKTNNLPHYPLIICYEEKFIKETNIKFLGIRINNNLNWKSHVDQMIPKFSATYEAVRMIFHINNINTLQMIYLAYFLSVMKHGKVFWRNSVDRGRVFTLQER